MFSRHVTLLLVVDMQHHMTTEQSAVEGVEKKMKAPQENIVDLERCLEVYLQVIHSLLTVYSAT